MVGIIEHQQGFSNSSLIEKIQQSKQDNLTVYQQYAAVDMQEKNVQKKKAIAKPENPNNILIHEKENQKGKSSQKKNSSKKNNDNEVTADSDSDHIIDIIV